MDLTRLAVDAGQFINRAVQYTGESLGQTDKTELDPGLEELQSLADATKTRTDKIISQTEVLLQPNPGARFEDRIYEHLDWSVPLRPRASEELGDQMTQAGLEIGSNTPYGSALLRCGEVQKQLGTAERKFAQSTNIHFLSPLRSFTEVEYKSIQGERGMLLNKRLDLDIAKTRLRKAYEAEREASNLNANPVEDDYLSHVSYMFSFLRVKWLKIWAQEISQAEMELGICQSLFNYQAENTRRILEGISNTHANHMRSLTEFVEAQASYYDQCNKHAQDLQKQLASIPAVLCSNNWQSEVSNASNQLSTSNHVFKESIGLNQISADPVVVHHLPDFDQDSWTTNPLTGTENTITYYQTNNNNNNSFSTDGHVARCHLISDGLQSTDLHPTTLNSASAWSMTSRQTLTFSATAAADSVEEGAMTSPSSQPSQISGSVDDFNATGAASSESSTTNDKAVEAETANDMGNGQNI